MFKLTSNLFTIFVVLLLAANVEAQVSSWDGGNDTDFGDAANWTNGIPDANTIAAIGPHADAENGAVFLDEDREIGGLLITDGMIMATANHELTVNNVNVGGLSIAGGNFVNDNNWRPS